MPYSWVSVPTSTAPELDECLGEAGGKAPAAIEQVATRHGGALLDFYWDADADPGTLACVRLFAPSDDQMDRILAALGGQVLARLADWKHLY